MARTLATLWLVIGLAACTSSSSLIEPSASIFGVWNVDRIQLTELSADTYDDDYRLIIGSDYLIEHIKDWGKRRWRCKLENDSLIVQAGEGFSPWRILRLTNTEMELDSPVGVYYLTKISQAMHSTKADAFESAF